MLKKTITYEDLDGNTVTEDFYFNLTKLELLEHDIEWDGGLEAHIQKLTETDNAKDAYSLFKDILLSSYGVRVDNTRFRKTEESRLDFEASPALSELIFGMLQNPAEGAKFIEEILPKNLVAEVKAEMAKNEDAGTQVVEGEVAAPPPPTRKELTEMSRDELLEAMRKKNAE